MYKPKYTFWNEKLYPSFNESLSRIYDDSLNNYIENHSEIKGNEVEIFKTFLNDLERYYAAIISLGIVTEKNYRNILERLEALSLIVIPKKRNLYGATLGNQISINPSIEGEFGLSKNEMLQLCISHELGHLINNKWKMEVKDFSKELYDDPRNKDILNDIGIYDPKYLQFGFDLLDEVVAEEAAERVNYRLFKKNANNLYNHNPYISNHILYNELYPYAYDFARGLDYTKVSHNTKNDEVILKLIRRSFDSDFIKEIKREIQNSDYKKREKLITMLACMGKIKASSYQVVGINKDREEIDVDHYIELFDEIKRRK